MTQNSENIGLTEVAIVLPPTVEQNELIAQLMQHIAELRVELQKKQDLSISIVDINNPSDGRLPLYFPHLNSNSKHVLNNPPSNPVQNPSTIDLIIPNLHHTSASYLTPPPLQSLNLNPQVFPPFQSLNVNNPQTSTFMYQTLQKALKIHLMLNPYLQKSPSPNLTAPSLYFLFRT